MFQISQLVVKETTDDNKKLQEDKDVLLTMVNDLQSKKHIIDNLKHKFIVDEG